MLRWQDGQRRHLVRSRRLAGMIQSELNAVFGVEQSVREAPLAVLAPVMGPAVLVEAGFISHPSDRNRLHDPEFQAQIADAIVRGLLRFLR
jgi:N-acetylmuramoyl-L-alanine amidase